MLKDKADPKPAASARAFARQQAAIATLLQQAVRRFEVLDREAEQRTELRRFVASLRRQRVKVLALVRATRRRDRKAVRTLVFERGPKLNSETNRLARSLGFVECLSAG